MPNVKSKKVTKIDGSKEELKVQKIIKSLLNVGVPDKTAKEIVNNIQEQIKDEVTTREIRAMILEELEQRNPKWHEHWVLHDRFNKNRITYEKGRFIEVPEGNLYLGREVSDIGEKGLSDVAEVQGIIRELEVDLEQGLPKTTINSRTYVLYTTLLKTKKMEKAEKQKALGLLNAFRKSLGWDLYVPKKLS